MKKLPCDNLNDFIYGNRVFYTVDEPIQTKEVILTDGRDEQVFEVVTQIRHADKIVLGLRRAENEPN